MTDKHPNFDALNLIGYGLAKFDMKFVNYFGFSTKTALYDYLIQLGVAETPGTIKNRQDLFDPFFDNGRVGWWQKGGAYIHRKTSIDELFGTLDVTNFAQTVQLFIQDKFDLPDKATTRISPITKSKFKQLQETGKNAEIYFVTNYNKIPVFRDGILTDARLYGDGYDFQIEVNKQFLLAEIKGLYGKSGSVRLTRKEYSRAKKHNSDYFLVVVSDLHKTPQMSVVNDPIRKIEFTRNITKVKQVSYHSNERTWKSMIF